MIWHRLRSWLKPASEGTPSPTCFFFPSSSPSLIGKWPPQCLGGRPAAGAAAWRGVVVRRYRPQSEWTYLEILAASFLVTNVCVSNEKAILVKIWAFITMKHEICIWLNLLHGTTWQWSLCRGSFSWWRELSMKTHSFSDFGTTKKDYLSWMWDVCWLVTNKDTTCLCLQSVGNAQP